MVLAWASLRLFGAKTPAGCRRYGFAGLRCDYAAKLLLLVGGFGGAGAYLGGYGVMAAAVVVCGFDEGGEERMRS
jgi:hypothetical protein